MDKFFWPIIGVVFVLALGLWVFGTRSIQAEISDARTQLEMQESAIQRLAAAPEQVKGPASIAVAKAHKERLVEERDRLLQIMRERDFDVGSLQFEPARPRDRDMALFRVWLTGQYSMRAASLGEAGVFLPSSAADRGEVANWEEVGPGDMDRLVEELAIGNMVSDALAGAGAMVTYTVEDPTLGRVTTETRRHGVDELIFIGFGDDQERRPTWRRRPSEEDEAKPFEEKYVRVVFLSHFKVVPEVIRRLEAADGSAPVFVVKSIASMRLTEVQDTGFGARTQQQEDKEYLIENPDREKPVRTSVRLAYLGFPVAREAAQ